MTTTGADVVDRRALTQALTSYALHLHETAEDDHHVLSALGAWLLLALAAPAVELAGPPDVPFAAAPDVDFGVVPDADADDELVRELGADPGTARSWAAALLADPHPAVHAATALWLHPDLDLARAQRLQPPAQVEIGSLPDQAGLDRWASEHTLGMITSLPLPDDTVIALVSALALSLRWRQPLERVPAAELGGPFASLVERALAASFFDDVRLIDTARLDPGSGAGVVAAVRADAEGLAVWSVIADADVPRRAVLAAAHRIACAGPVDLDRADALWDVPADPGDSPAAAAPGRPWAVVETRVPTAVEGERSARGHAYLPAWSAQTDRDLAVVPLLRVVDAVRRLVAPERDADQLSAKQTARARYSSEGFTAAALTWAVAAGGMPVLAHQGVERTLTARFGHPYACIAVVDGQADWGEDGDARGGAWRGLPLFSAWVAEPEEAETRDPAPASSDRGGPVVPSPWEA